MSLVLNKATIAGHLGNDVAIRSTTGDRRVANFRVATNSRFKGKDGSTKERTTWHSIVVYGSDKFINAIEKHGRRGAAVYVEGEIRTREYTDKNNVDREVTEIVVSGPAHICRFPEARAGTTGPEAPEDEEPPIDDFGGLEHTPF